MHAEIIATGSELLLGEVVDTNSTYIARQLRDIGLNLYYKTVVGDNEVRMAEALSIALKRSDVIITTGGLGPTIDDVTRPAIARAVDKPLIFREDLLDQIQARFRAYGVPMGDNNRRQAFVPDGATPIENPVGTAPAFIVEQAGRLIISLPGVPREMEYLIEHAVLPYLKAKLDLKDVIVIRTVHTVGQGESRIDEAIGDLEEAPNPTVGLSAKAGQVDIRIAAKAATRAEAEALNAAMEATVRERVGKFIFGVDADTLESVVAQALTDRSLSLASVECGTNGLLGGRLATIGAAFRGGLTVSELPLDLARAIAVANEVRAAHASDLALSVSVGRAADGPGLKLVVALTGLDQPATLERGFGGHSALAAQWASTAALGLVWRKLMSDE
ncbi:MAG: CinA family nicotinamide mononucleotide deamidase-related protein [Thermoflexales bacterium]|nr:CinA family nicotinamide mononucleotide deamidase-related protein [Thermoflexales bacterium]